MKKSLILFMACILSGCTTIVTPMREEVIDLYSETSKLYTESLKDEHSMLLKTYHHKKFGEIPYVDIEEFCNIFPLSSVDEARQFGSAGDKCFISNPVNGGSFTFDANRDTITTSDDVNYFFYKSRRINNDIPLDLYVPSKFEKVTKGSSLTKQVTSGRERVYFCKNYGFDIVHEKEKFFAPFSLLNAIFFEYLNESYIYNGKNYFDLEYLSGESQTIQYCYSSKGDFLLDFSGGKLGLSLYERKDPVGDEEYRFVNVIEASGQTTIFSLKDGKGTIKSYKEDGSLIDEGTYRKVKYELKDDVLVLQYYFVLDEEDWEDKAISEIYTMYINMDETYFHKGTRSKEVADFTYQELRFAMYELYGWTRNNLVRDFDYFINNRAYKNDLLSLDIKTYDEAMSKFLLMGIDDGHTSIETTSIFGLPTKANANSYITKISGNRTETIHAALSQARNLRETAGLSEGLDISGETAFLSFDKFATQKGTDGKITVKKYEDYKGTNPSDYVKDSTMEFFASAFNKIEEDTNVKNVVIDLTCNSGGKTATMAYLLSYLTDDPTIDTYLMLNGAYNQYHYTTDLNQDGVFGSKSDTFKDKYNFYILTSGGSFSCGNHFPTICKNYGYATIIGDRSAGGSCVVSTITNSSGFIYDSSSEYIALIKDGNGYSHNDDGVIPNRTIEPELWFNHAELNNLLKNI